MCKYDSDRLFPRNKVFMVHTRVFLDSNLYLIYRLVFNNSSIVFQENVLRTFFVPQNKCVFET